MTVPHNPQTYNIFSIKDIFKLTAFVQMYFRHCDSSLKAEPELPLVLGESQQICTCQLFLDLHRVVVLEQRHHLCDATAAMNGLLVAVAFKGKVA